MNKLQFVFTVLVTFFTVFTVSGQEAVDSTEVDKIDVSQLPQVSPYFLQHQYLSVLAEMIDEKDGEILADPVILNTYSANGNGFRSPFQDYEISVSTFEDEGKKIYIWQFPEPEYLREALYMAFIPVNGKYKAFAISIGELVDWELSTSTQNYRSTTGRVKRPETAAECLEILKARGAYSGTTFPGEFFQEGYKGPSYRPQ